MVVDLRSMQSSYLALKEHRSIIQNKKEELLRIQSALKTLSVMEGIKEQLDRILKDLEEELRVLSQMMQVLSKAIEFYSKCEQRVIDNCEGNRICYKKEKIEYTNLNHVENILLGLGL